MNYLYGQELVAGHGISTVLMSGDFETYSEAGYVRSDAAKWSPAKKGSTGINAVGGWAYTRHASARVLVFRYDLKDGAGIRYWRPGLPNPLELFAKLEAGYLFEAMNSFFEFCVWTNICVPLYGWPPLNLWQVIDVAAKSGTWTLPRKLEDAARILDTPIQKDKAGSKVMKKVSKPHTPTRKEPFEIYTRENSPADFAILDEYCADDVRAEDGVSMACPDLSPFERRVFHYDQAINARGVKCDRAVVDACLEIIRQARLRYNAEVAHLTHGYLKTSDQLEKLKAWLLVWGINAPSITKDTLPELLEMEMPERPKRVLQIRASLGSKSVIKTQAMSRMMDPADDRLRGLFTYAGAARTWRWSGGAVQSQNLPKSGPKVVRCIACAEVHWAGLGFCPSCFSSHSRPTGWGIEAAETCINALMTRSLDIVESLWGDALLAIAGCLRSFFIAGPGMEFKSSDLSSIEAVVIAELAGEAWQQEVFRGDGKIYEATASMITGVPLEEFARYKSETGMDHPQRALGKVAALASGYGGWIKAWIKFGADKFMNEEEMKQGILKWRRKSPAIVALWAGLQEACISAIEQPGCAFEYRGLAFQTHNDVLYGRLPSGRCIPYHRPRVTWGERNGRREKQITYWGVDSQTKRWLKMKNYGGKLAEQFTQATARDIFAAGIVRLEDAGYAVVMHTHDEPCCEVEPGFGSPEEIEQLMTVPLEWCADWPIKASGGWAGQRYRKA